MKEKCMCFSDSEVRSRGFEAVQCLCPMSDIFRGKKSAEVSIRTLDLDDPFP